MKRLITLSILLCFALISCNQGGKKATNETKNPDAVESTKEQTAEIQTIIAQAGGWSFSTSGLCHFGFQKEDGTHQGLVSRSSETPGIKLITDNIPPNQEPPANFVQWFEVKFQEKEYEYMSGGSDEPIKAKDLFIVSVEPIEKKIEAINISDIKIGNDIEGMSVTKINYTEGDGHEIHLNGKPMLSGEFSWNEYEECYFLHCKSASIISEKMEGEMPLYEFIRINNLEEMKAELSSRQLKAFEAKEPFNINFRFYGMQCYTKYGKGMLGAASTDYYDVN